MKEKISNLSELTKMLLLATLVALISLGIALIPLFTLNLPGWLIGIAMGSFIEIISIILLYKGSEIALSSFKAWHFLLFYFTRMTLFLAGMVVAALLQYGIASFAPVEVFKYALWGVLIGYAPMQIVVIAVMMFKKKSPLTISEKKESND